MSWRGDLLRFPFLLFAGVIVALTAAGMVLTLMHQRDTDIARLQAICDLKSRQIGDWLEERRSDVDFVRSNVPLPEDAQGGAPTSIDATRFRATLMRWQQNLRFDSVALFDLGSGNLVGADGQQSAAGDVLKAGVARSTREHTSQTVGPYRTPEGHIAIDFVAPLGTGAFSLPVAVLRVDPMRWLFPTLRTWPGPSPTGEMFLFRWTKEYVEYLTPLLHDNDAVGRLHMPLTKHSVLAVQVALGEIPDGAPSTGTDYRGTAVIGVSHHIPGTDWTLLAKIDRAEWYGEAFGGVVSIGLAGLLTLLAGAAGAGMVRQRQELAVAGQVQRAQQQRLDALQLLDAIVGSSTDAIFAKDVAGRYLLFNREAVRISGKAAETILGRDDRALFPPEQAARVMADDARVMATREPVSSRHILTTADGERTFLATKGPLFDASGAVSGTYGISRDVTHQIEADERVHASEERLRFALGASRDGLWDLDLRTGAAHLAPRYYEIIGYRPDEIAADFDALKRAIHPDDLERVMASFDAHLAGGPAFIDLEHRIIARSGECRWVTARGTAVAWDDAGRPTRMVGTISDITSRKQSEAALHQLSQVVQQSPEGIMITDIAGNVEYVNEAFVRNTGYSREEVTGLNARMFGAGTTPAATFADMWQTLVAGSTWKGEFHNRRKDGTEYVDFAVVAPIRQLDGRITHYAAVHEDITERKRLDAELDSHRHHLEALVEQRTAELSLHRTQFESILDAIPGGVGYWDDQMYNRFSNPAYRASVGLALDQVSGRHVRDIVDAARYAAILPHMERALRGERQTFEISYIAPKSGRQRHAEVRYVPDFRDVKVVGFFSMTFDISELKAARDAAEAANLSKSAFLANMSHEIRTPMNAILGLTHLLKRSSPSPEQSARLDKIGTAGKHLLAILSDVLDLSKIEAGRLTLEQTDFRLSAVLNHVHELVAESASAKGLSVEIDCADVPALLTGDPTRLRQALLNFAGNAVKFTERGRVVLRVRPEERRGEEILLRFEVQDTGIGIAADKIPELFQAFAQADPSTTRKYGGTGLGLAISQRLATLMGGDVGVKSEPGVGSTFWFTAWLRRCRSEILPAEAGPDEDATAAVRRIHSGSRLLLVEDDKVNQEVAQALLAEAGLAVDTADDGQRAVAMAEASDYDLILMDMQMPGMDGLAATRAIRAGTRHRRTPILAMTANAFADDRGRCLAAGMNDFVTKPVDADVLFDKIFAWLAKPHERQQTTLDSGSASSQGGAPEHRSRMLPPERGAATDAPAGPSFGGDPDLIDLAVPARIFKSDPTKMRRVTQKFLVSTRAELPAFDRALADGDMAAVAALGHRFKSAAASMGAMGLADLYRSLESCGHRGDAVEAAALVARLAPLIDRIAAEIERHPVLVSA